MTHFKIEVFASGIKFEPKIVSYQEVTEELRQLGLEWKITDNFNERSVVILITPVDLDKDETIKSLTGKLSAVAEVIAE